MSFTTEVKGLREMVKFADNLPDRILREMFKTVSIATLITQREAMRAVRRHFTQRTGKLRRSWQMKVISRKAAGPSQLAGGRVTGKVSTDHPGAVLLSEGGTVRPKVKDALTIPLTEQAWKYPAVAHPRAPFFALRGYLWELTASGGLHKAHYALRKSATIPQTGYLEDIALRSMKVLAEQGIKNVTIAVSKA